MKYRYDIEKGHLVEAEPIQLTEAQEEFFKYSKMRDSDGDLGIFYHYTVHKFDAFDPNTIGNQSGDAGYFGKGFYFTGSPSFNSCCFPDKEKGEELVVLQCYLNIEKPFLFDKLEAGKRDYDEDNIYVYDKEEFLQYLKNNSENGIDIILSEEDFIEYMKDNYEYDKYEELIQKYEDGEIDFYEDYEGMSLDYLYREARDYGYIIIPENLYFGKIHRGLLSEYSQQITDYAKENGFDGIVSDGTGCRAIEIVVFEPNQIKSIDNLYPTYSDNFKDNSEEYFRKNSINKDFASLEDKLAAAEQKAALHNKGIENKTKDDLSL